MNNNNMNFDALGIRPDEWDMLVSVDLEDIIAADHPGQSEEDRIWLQRVIRAKKYLMSRESVISSSPISFIDTNESLNDRLGEQPMQSVLVSSAVADTNAAAPTNGLASANERKGPTAQVATNVGLPAVRLPQETNDEGDRQTESSAPTPDAEVAWGSAHWVEVHLWNNWGASPYNQRPSPKASPTKYRAKVFFNYRSGARTYNPGDFLLCDFTNGDKWMDNRPGGDADKPWYAAYWEELYEYAKTLPTGAQPMLIGHLRDAKTRGQSGTKRHVRKSAILIMEDGQSNPIVVVADGTHQYQVQLRPTLGGKTKNADWKGEWAKEY